MIDAAMTRSRTVILGLIVILVAGLYAYVTIPKEAEPDIEIPDHLRADDPRGHLA